MVQLKDELTRVDGEIAEADAPTDEQSQHVEILRGEIETTEKTVATLKSIEQGLKLKAVQTSAIKHARHGGEKNRSARLHLPRRDGAFYFQNATAPD